MKLIKFPQNNIDPAQIFLNHDKKYYYTPYELEHALYSLIIDNYLAGLLCGWNFILPITIRGELLSIKISINRTFKKILQNYPELNHSQSYKQTWKDFELNAITERLGNLLPCQVIELANFDNSKTVVELLKYHQKTRYNIDSNNGEDHVRLD